MKPLLFLLLPLACLYACKPKTDDPKPGITPGTGTTSATQREYKPGYISASIINKTGDMVACGMNENGQPMVLKFADNNGRIAWSKIFTNETAGTLSGIVESGAGNYAVCGTVVSDSGDYDTRISIINESGEITWQRTFGTEKDETHPCIGLSVHNNFTSTIIAVAQEAEGGHDMVIYFKDQQSNANGEIFKATGHQIPYSIAHPKVGGISVTGSSHATVAARSKMITGLYTWEMPTIQNELDGGNVISRHNLSIGDNSLVVCGSTSNGKCKGFIASTDKSGKMNWHKEYAADENMLLNHIAEDKDGFVAVGHLFGNDEHGTTECVILKTDKAGNELWRKTLGSSTNINDEAVSVCQKADGSYLVLCNSTDKTNSGNPAYRYFMTSISAPEP